MAELIFTGEEAVHAPKIFAERFGESIFTTMFGTQLWPRHYARLQHHCAQLGYDLPSEHGLLSAIEHKQTSGKKIRILVAKTDHALSFEAYTPPPATIYQGVRVHVSSITVDDRLRYFKSTDRKIYERALKDAQAQNCFEALLKDGDGHVVDGARTSLLLYDGHKTFTWPLGGINGVMRAEVADYLKENGFAVRQSHVCLSDIWAQQLLLCNSLLGVVPVGQVQHPLVVDLVKRFSQNR